MGVEWERTAHLPRNTETQLEKEIAFEFDIKFENVLGTRNNMSNRDTHVVTHKKGHGMLRVCYEV